MLRSVPFFFHFLFSVLPDGRFFTELHIIYQFTATYLLPCDYLSSAPASDIDRAFHAFATSNVTFFAAFVVARVGHAGAQGMVPSGRLVQD
jgi:hypothetical protein